MVTSYDISKLPRKLRKMTGSDRNKDVLLDFSVKRKDCLVLKLSWKVIKIKPKNVIYDGLWDGIVVIEKCDMIESTRKKMIMGTEFDGIIKIEFGDNKDVINYEINPGSS